VEGSACSTYSMCPGPGGLEDALGGEEGFSSKLQEFFSKGYDDRGKARIGITLSIRRPAGQAWRSQGLIRNLLERTLETTRRLPGNDEGGSLSAGWFFLVGFYPFVREWNLCLGKPVFRDSKILLNPTYYSGGT